MAVQEIDYLHRNLKNLILGCTHSSSCSNRSDNQVLIASCSPPIDPHLSRSYVEVPGTCYLLCY